MIIAIRNELQNKLYRMTLVNETSSIQIWLFICIRIEISFLILQNRSPKVMSELKELNSPAALLGKTIERMRAQREAASVVSMVAGRVSGSTPERVEFENFKRNLRADLVGALRF